MARAASVGPTASLARRIKALSARFSRKWQGDWHRQATGEMGGLGNNQSSATKASRNLPVLENDRMNVCHCGLHLFVKCKPHGKVRSLLRYLEQISHVPTEMEWHKNATK
mmetsp:Transcript_11009/g.25609  ORF Transcript_11009/g.25609 Transcript_11009/m.25609 type:complete len:110 (-) Transcript_11009:18-347(-)